MIGVHRDCEYSVGKNIQHNIKEMKRKYMNLALNKNSPSPNTHR
jgi:hypothetical protein